MSFPLDEVVPTIMANFTCYTGNCTTVASSSSASSSLIQAATSSEVSVLSQSESAVADVVPYTTLQATLIGVASGLFSLVTIMGNFMVMISFKMDKQLQTISNYFLFSLAVADLIIGLISMPLQTVYIIHQVSQRQIGSFFFYYAAWQQSISKVSGSYCTGHSRRSITRVT